MCKIYFIAIKVKISAASLRPFVRLDTTVDGSALEAATLAEVMVAPEYLLCFDFATTSEIDNG